jgi:hypothetical protein
LIPAAFARTDLPVLFVKLLAEDRLENLAIFMGVAQKLVVVIAILDTWA